MRWKHSYCPLEATLLNADTVKSQYLKRSSRSSKEDMVYKLKMFPSLCTDKWILPDSCSSSFRKRPTFSEYRTSQNTQISARSRWMLALHVGNPELRTDRVREHHTWKERDRFLNIRFSFLITSLQGIY
ncbi:hypothetical protein ILYODFUR_031659 [Ilyodon furcidens]|uniref:Uncharacterized protein n=1 Tax=Ilyodon furcidens TaxID=33524 RepID=A0ABV0SQS6_9TELE